MLKKRIARIMPLVSFVLLVFLISLFLFQDIKKTSGSDGLRNGYEKLLNGKPIHYLVIGDSIGRSSGAETPQQTWFTMLEEKLKSKHRSSFKSDHIVQSGSTAFEGLYQFTNSKVSVDQDFIFIIFGENDRKYMSANQFKELYEELIRNAKERFPHADIVTITESCLKNDQFAQVIQELSTYYNTAHIDMRPVFEHSGLTEKQLTKDGVHPNGRGYQLYANTIYTALEKNINNGKQISALPNPLVSETSLSFATIEKPDRINGFNRKGSYLNSGRKGHSVTYRFTGTLLGVHLLRSPDGGEVDVFIDGKKAAVLSTWWPFARERYVYIASSLPQGHHTVRFEVSGRSSAYNQSNHSMVRIAAIITDKNP